MNLSAKVFAIIRDIALSVGLIHSPYGGNGRRSEDSDTILQNNLGEEGSTPQVKYFKPFLSFHVICFIKKFRFLCLLQKNSIRGVDEKGRLLKESENDFHRNLISG